MIRQIKLKMKYQWTSWKIYAKKLIIYVIFPKPTVCRNPICQNRARFMLDIDKSRYVDFQKVRIQETQAELPKGCIPRR